MSGGEPSTQDLYETCFDIKRLYPELKLKVFTNAQKPESVRACLDLVDFWSIDYKTVTKPDMNKVLGIDLPNYEFNVLDTIRLLDKNKKDYQVRIWKHPSHSLNDIDSMCNRVRNINTEINYELVDILK